MAKVFVMCGVPGSGKSFAAQNLATVGGYKVISSDAIRAELYGDESIQGKPSEVFEAFYKKAHEAISQGSGVILDATNIKRKDRRKVFAEFPSETIVAVIVNTPLETCIERNAKRSRVVPEHVIRRMWNNFEVPTMEEGFNSIIYTNQA